MTYSHHGYHLLHPLCAKLLFVHLHLVDAFLWSIWVEEEGVPPNLKGFLVLQFRSVLQIWSSVTRSF